MPQKVQEPDRPQITHTPVTLQQYVMMDLATDFTTLTIIYNKCMYFFILLIVSSVCSLTRKGYRKIFIDVINTTFLYFS